MPSASYTLKEQDTATDVVFTLVGNTPTGAEYKVVSRSLALPQNLKLTFVLGNPGARGNDHVKIQFNNTIADADAVSHTGSVTIDLSIPRNSAWTTTDSEDLLAFVANLLTTARIPYFADAMAA